MAADARGELPPYARVVADIRARIAGGELQPGDRVPSTREITREWGVAMATATKALSALRQAGLVEAVRGVGTVVRRAAEAGPVPPGPLGRAPSRSSGQPPRQERHDAEKRREYPGAEERRASLRAAIDGRDRPAPDTALTRAAVVRAAITVADEEGLSGLSMRRVSTELRVSTMALYRHIDNKDELLREMVDEVYTEVELPDPVPSDWDWRQAVEVLQQREWAVYRAHPWLATLVTVTRPVMSEKLLAYGEWVLGLLVDRGCSPDDGLRVITILTAYMSGMALQVSQVKEMERETGTDSAEFWAGKGAELTLDEARYPNMFRVSAPPEFDIDRTFALGMAHLIDGLAPMIESGGSPGNGRPPGNRVPTEQQGDEGT
ncbi:TetR/AcrR family transcriptional regulator C-terminal domain-containing protein [Nocardiopsis metallicus]|uniref:AcrR family transcriptional regulator n=1 Tax=Nocardiopsis metallicus TaxID=179819 RepID=A0A840WC75_9ACTN|nr:TetR/AcrR family transcriptional regulator C-terminal domain-containing protein [Nocardiopsis metallicus]MBB5493762.1 AcrR family transcriptional regulator [Nocardiopsis metallicus]